jgi:4-carboxymuconolactone decarboxylase
MGDAYVERALASKHVLSEDLQGLLNDFAWGSIWSRPGLERTQRSLITIALLVALNRPHELRLHLEAGIRNGLTREQIMEAILHCVVYCGFPAMLDAVRLAREVLPLDEH